MANNADNKIKAGKGPGAYTPEMSWESWSERFEFFIKLKSVTDPEIKKLLFFSELGPVYDELRRMAQPDDVREMEFDEITKLMDERFGEVKSIAAKRHELFNAKQGGQTIRDYSIQLRSLISKADWGKDSIDMCLTALFINGIKNDTIRAELIKKGDKDLKFKDAVELAVILEQSSVDAHAIGSNSFSAKGEIAKISAAPKQKNAKKIENGNCYRCGNTQHWSNNCPHKNDKCNKCKKVGHWAKMCKTKSDGNDNWNKGSNNGKSSKGGKGINQINVEEAKQNSIAKVNNESVQTGLVSPRFIEMQVHNGIAQFELDPGADVTIMNSQDWKLIGRPKLEQKRGLFAYGGIPIDGIMGIANVKVGYNGALIQSEIYVVDGQRKNLCGRPWIQELQIDLNKAFGIGTIQNISIKNELNSVLNKYSEVFKEGLGTCRTKVGLKFKEGAQPKCCKPRPVPYSLRSNVEQVLDQWQKDGVVTPVETSDWATPIVIVPKANGQIRVCADYKVTVNPWLDIHQYPIPRSEELFSLLNGGQKFTKLDLKDAYLQLPLDDQAKKSLTICTNKGLFQMNRLPFGVASAPAIFQHKMEEILQGIDGVGAFFDDVVLTGKNDTEHLQTLAKVLERFQKNGLKLKKEKCQFMQESVEYLGHKIDKNGIRTSEKKIEAIEKMPAPKNLKELQSFLGLVNYYSKFVPAMATISEPLNELRRTGVKWKWGSGQQKAFNEIKEMLKSSEILAHYDPEKPLYLAADASDYGIGAVLFHKDKNGKVGVIAYASKTLSMAERNYAQIEKEGRAIIFGVEKFKQYLLGRKFILQTDHEPLKKIFGPKGEIPVVAARRLHRWALILMGYDFDMEYVATKEFGNADGLSRLPSPEIAEVHKVQAEIKEIQEDTLGKLLVTAKAIAEESKNDNELKLVIDWIEKGWPNKIEESFKPYYLARNELEIIEGCIMLGCRTVIPRKFRQRMLQILHSTHPGMVRMKSLARQKMWWPGIDKEIEQIRKECTICQSNSNEERQVPLYPWEEPDKVWQRLHVDFAGPFLGSMWLIVVDAKSKWPEIVKMRTISAEATVKAVRNLFFAHGIPEQIVSDNGTQFTSAEWKKFCEERGIIHTLTPPYHPQSNGEAERMVQSFKNGMKLQMEDGFSPDEGKDQFLLRYRITPHSATKISPAEMLFGRKLRTILDLVKPIPKGEIKAEKSKYKERMKRNFDKRTREKAFEVGQNVFARNYRDGHKWIQGKILKEIGSAMFLIRTARGIWRRHFDQLKADWTSNEEDESEIDDEENPEGEFEGQLEVALPENEQPAIEQQMPVIEPELPPVRRSNRNRRAKQIFDPS